MTYTIESLKKLAKLELGLGDRLSRIIAKGGKIGSRSMESVGCIVPAVGSSLLSGVMGDKRGQEFLASCVAGVQDKLIRARVAAGHLTVYPDHIGLEALLGAMEVENEVTRFSKESIKVWFNEVLHDPLHDALKAKMPAASDEVLRKYLANYLESFQVLAQRNPSMKAEVKAGLLRALDFVPADHESVTATEIVSRLAVVQEASVILAAL